MYYDRLSAASWRSCLRHSAANRIFTGWILDGVMEIFH